MNRGFKNIWEELEAPTLEMVAQIKAMSDHERWELNKAFLWDKIQYLLKWLRSMRRVKVAEGLGPLSEVFRRRAEIELVQKTKLLRRLRRAGPYYNA